jgi:hypothetical protein
MKERRDVITTVTEDYCLQKNVTRFSAFNNDRRFCAIQCLCIHLPCRCKLLQDVDIYLKNDISQCVIVMKDKLGRA